MMGVKVAWADRRKLAPAILRELQKRLGDIEVSGIQSSFQEMDNVTAELRERGVQCVVTTRPQLANMLKERLPELAVWYVEVMVVHENCFGEACRQFNKERDIVEEPRHLRYLALAQWKKGLRL